MSCCYCRHPITPEDDGQRIKHGTFAHTACAWAADEMFWQQVDTARSDTESEQRA